MKILVISLAGIGDTLMATPLIHELKENFPDSEIDVLVMWESSKNILSDNPNVNEIFCFNMLKEGFYRTIRFCRELKKKNYDISINTYPQSKTQYRLVAKLIGAETRISHRYANWNFLDNFLVDKTIEEDYSKTCSENNLNLLKLLDKEPKLKKHEYEIYLTLKERFFAEGYIKKNRLGNKKLFGFHVGSGTTKNLGLRRWPLENYISLIRLVLNRYKNSGILLFGGKNEEQLNSQIRKEINDSRIFTVETESIKEDVSLLKKCDVFVSVDTSSMHLATAAKTKKQIIIETPTLNDTVIPPRSDLIIIKNPGIVKNKLDYYSYDGKGIKASKEEMESMMKTVTPEMVFDAVKKI
ncbi:MAG TPA: glycosyltransferase family 9 protein [Patescibacteria group bacterium]|nr:glycosyltransferase family 9 protein [Patescibacteria group bacterium]